MMLGSRRDGQHTAVALMTRGRCGGRHASTGSVAAITAAPCSSPSADRDSGARLGEQPFGRAERTVDAGQRGAGRPGIGVSTHRPSVGDPGGAAGDVWALAARHRRRESHQQVRARTLERAVERPHPVQARRSSGRQRPAIERGGHRPAGDKGAVACVETRELRHAHRGVEAADGPAVWDVRGEDDPLGGDSCEQLDDIQRREAGRVVQDVRMICEPVREHALIGKGGVCQDERHVRKAPWRGPRVDPSEASRGQRGPGSGRPHPGRRRRSLRRPHSRTRKPARAGAT